MRLIDADTLEKDLKSVTLSNGTLINTNTMIALINKYPTAYDINKVVDGLEDYKNMFGDEDRGYIQNEIEKAIEIVKAGGKNEID